MRGITRGLGMLLVLVCAGATVLLADSLHVFSGGDLISADRMNRNFEKMAPVGSIIAFHKDLPGAPGLPEGWVECSGQTISDGESVFDGVTLPDLNNARNGWNANGSFLRGSTSSGVFHNDRFQGHSHVDPGHSHGYTDTTVEYFGTDTGYSVAGGPSGVHLQGRMGNSATTASSTAGIGAPNDNGSGTPRTGDETVPVHMTVVYIIRIK